MIELTRLNGSRLAVNCDLIKYAEAAPDTMLTLVTGEKLVVLEPCTRCRDALWNIAHPFCEPHGPKLPPR